MNSYVIFTAFVEYAIIIPPSIYKYIYRYIYLFIFMYL